MGYIYVILMVFELRNVSESVPEMFWGVFWFAHKWFWVDIPKNISNVFGNLLKCFWKTFEMFLENF